MMFFTSDTHFNHANILAYCKRPFESLWHMNAELVRRWNERVAPTDVVYHLGDFALGPKNDIPGFFAQLNGEKILIVGNHDGGMTRRLSWLRCLPYIVIEGVGYCVHNPAHAPQHASETLVLHGHLHGTPDLHPFQRHTRLTYADVGVDCWDFRPVTLPEIEARHGRG
jgi:calcineurin-like phosphoesterase family protein